MVVLPNAETNHDSNTTEKLHAGLPEGHLLMPAIAPALAAMALQYHHIYPQILVRSQTIGIRVPQQPWEQNLLSFRPDEDLTGMPTVIRLVFWHPVDPDLVGSVDVTGAN
jgi:hypothetical protein